MKYCVQGEESLSCVIEKMKILKLFAICSGVSMFEKLYSNILQAVNVYMCTHYVYNTTKMSLDIVRK